MSIQQIALARELGITKQAVNRHVARGMPTATIGAAWRWYRENVRMVVGQGIDRDRPPPGVLVERVGALLPAARDAIASGRFEHFETELRAALRAVPESHRERVTLPLEVWDRLTHAVGEVARDDQGDRPATEEDASSRFMGNFWYQVAAGEIVVAG